MRSIKNLINEEIKGNVQIVTEDGLSGVYSLDKALDIADEAGLDLVEMSVKDNVSICKLMDYNKYTYELSKKTKQIKNRSDVVKEIKFKNHIADHDLQTRANKATSLLKEGYKVKVAVQYRGREMSRITEGTLLIEKLKQMIEIEYTIIKDSKIEGNMYTTILEYK